jgi:histone chaperone ASF1
LPTVGQLRLCLPPGSMPIHVWGAGPHPQADPPNFQLIPPDDIVGVTVILLTCSYKSQEFLRVGYYVNNEYLEDELRDNPPDVPLIDRLHRSILADKPRVTKFNINWDGEQAPSGLQSGMDVDTSS